MAGLNVEQQNILQVIRRNPMAAASALRAITQSRHAEQRKMKTEKEKLLPGILPKPYSLGNPKSQTLNPKQIPNLKFQTINRIYELFFTR